MNSGGKERERVAIVTGGAQGIGRTTAEVLSDRGFRVAPIDLREPTETLASLAAKGAEAMSFCGDVADEAIVERFAGQVFARWSRADVLVNNAGISLIAPAEETSGADFRRMLEVNLLAPFLLARIFGREMLRAGHGSIVNVASVAGLVAVADRVAYNASKHGLVGLTRTLAAEWGGRGVRVNAVCPGWVKTEMDVADQAGGSYSDAPDLPVFQVQTIREAPYMLSGLLAFQLGAALAAIMGVLGLTLAVIGLYGVVSYAVSRRAHEIGLRIALGATRGTVFQMIYRQSLIIVGWSLVIGLAVALLAVWAVASFAAVRGAWDPATYAAVATVLALVALGACYLPARRAMAVEPVVALRED